MNKNRSWIKLCVYIVSVSVLFIYFLFPSDAVIGYIKKKLSNINPILSISTDRVRPVFPPGIRLYAVRFYHTDRSLFFAEKIDVTPGLLSIFQKKTILFFKGKAHEGILKGKVEISGDAGGHHVNINTQLSGIETSDITALREFAGFKITGRLDGNIAYDGGMNTGGSGSAKLVVSNGSIEPVLPLLVPGVLNFKSLEADLTVKDRLMQIKQCTVNGNQMDARFSGAITLKTPHGESELDLKGTLMPHPAVFDASGNNLTDMPSLEKG